MKRPKLRSREEMLESFCQTRIPDYLPANYVIDINISADFGVKRLEDIANRSEGLGAQLRREIIYDKTHGRQTLLKLKIHPSEGFLDVYEALNHIVVNFKKNKNYSEILAEREEQLLGCRYRELLRGLEKKSLGFRCDVGRFLEGGFEYCEKKYGHSFKELLSKRGRNEVAKLRQAFFYALSRKFPSTYGSLEAGEGLSTTDIGKIFSKDHATIVVTLKKIRDVLGESVLETSATVGSLIDEGYRVLKGDNSSKSQ